jgi:hypothetical protein
MGAMIQLLKVVTSWQAFTAYMAATALFGFAPTFVLTLLVKIYPKDDPRRTELPGELPLIRRIERPFWVAEQLATVLVEGVPHRIASTWQRIREGSAASRGRRAARRGQFRNDFISVSPRIQPETALDNVLRVAAHGANEAARNHK